MSDHYELVISCFLRDDTPYPPLEPDPVSSLPGGQFGVLVKCHRSR